MMIMNIMTPLDPWGVPIVSGIGISLGSIPRRTRLNEAILDP